MAAERPSMDPRQHHPLDLERTGYSYVERPNTVLVGLLERHVLRRLAAPRILDIGCGCGANAREVRRRKPGAYQLGIEPNPQAAALAAEICDAVHVGELASWLAQASGDAHFDAVVLSDVLEHVADPVGFLRALGTAPALREAIFVISVPNYAVWYNRLRTLGGRFDYRWSGLYDRTHLRFFTRRSVRELLAYCGFDWLDDRCTPSIVQSTAPLLRRFFERDVSAGNHLVLLDTPAYRFYQRVVEPIEAGACQVWPELLGLQIVAVARLRAAASCVPRGS
jgi:SAM-dependent methyltransferase